ncbi:hypothetical protein ABZ953_35645 [Streptomyces sp. NPDC046465]|uniref:hypothetical protein n=1 Tax=Streptomyces sp. NPDC046465 TaxID=3155810 RepID=UPI0033F9CD40
MTSGTRRSDATDFMAVPAAVMGFSHAVLSPSTATSPAGSPSAVPQAVASAPAAVARSRVRRSIEG